MNAVTSALVARVKANATVISLSGTYESSPAWFKGVAPENAPYPKGLITGPLRPSRQVFTKTDTILDLRYDLTGVVKEEGSEKVLEQLMEALFWEFRNTLLVVAGWNTINSDPGPPYSSDTDGTILAMTVPLEIKLQKA